MPTPLETRIINIQKTLRIPTTGIFDLATCKAIEIIKQVDVPANTSLFDHKKAVQKSLGFTGKDIDGLIGVGTISRVEQLVSSILPPIPVGSCMIVSKISLDIIIEAEVSSKATYNTKYKSAIWPGGESGVTIGIGYDLGFCSLAQFTSEWGAILSKKDFNTLATVLGKKGTTAKNAITNTIKSVEISWEQALEVFYTRSMPKYAKDTNKAYPGVSKLPPDAQGAILSLIYNRGSKIDNSDRRKEMKNLVACIAAGDLKKIAAEIRSMKRLWDSSQRGLLLRREREAVTVENATFFIQPNDYIFV